LQTYASYPLAPTSLPIHGAYPGEGQLVVRYREITGRYADGTVYRLRSPEYRVESPAYGPLASGVQFAPRLAPALGGVGLLEAVSEAEILARADPEDRDQDGISGRANRVWDHQLQRWTLGRFGHKASQPTLPQQIAVAFSDDMGLTSGLYPQSSCTSAQGRCTAAAGGADPQEGVEVTANVLAAVTAWVRALEVGMGRHTNESNTRSGQKAYADFGCAACHLPQLKRGSAAEPSRSYDRVIEAYTDLLLHDLGPALGDQRAEFQATGDEWRTAPLWGLSQDQRQPSVRGYLHDGRARDLAEAILWHGGEAERSREAFRQAPPQRRASLLRFLESL
jgi:CxxC motif-containing protein (DUF1111 family)